MTLGPRYNLDISTSDMTRIINSLILYYRVYPDKQGYSKLKTSLKMIVSEKMDAYFSNKLNKIEGDE